MKQGNLLLNASNLHTGGAVQVATSVIGEWCSFPVLPVQLEIWVSTEVDENLKQLGYNISKLPAYKVVDTYGMGMLFSPQAARLAHYQRVLTLFGPLYTLKKNTFTITGFAQAWIIYPKNEALQKLRFAEKIKIRAKFFLQKLFFRQSDELFVELEHVKTGLIANKIGHKKKIEIIHNCCSSIYFEPQRWLKLPRQIKSDKLKLGFVGRNHGHKNTAVFPKVIAHLKENHAIEAEFWVTFTNKEWEESSPLFKQYVHNVGAINVAQCPDFYNAVDAVVFPSLLESFSATPLEALAMKKPLFASDRAFNHDICKDNAVYFDPLNPEDVAAKIAAFFSLPEATRKQRTEKGYLHAISFSNAKQRAEKIIQLLDQ